MIEILVKYISDKGYRVDVLPGVLLIRKEAHEQIYSIGWAISKYDLQPDLEEILYDGADRRMHMLERAVEENHGFQQIYHTPNEPAARPHT